MLVRFVTGRDKTGVNDPVAHAAGGQCRGLHERASASRPADHVQATPAGKELGRVLGNTSIRSLAWHPAGWLAAATSSGRLAHLDISGNVRTYKGAGQGIESLLFIDAGRALLVCGAEKHFRVWPLLEDEAAST